MSGKIKPALWLFIFCCSAAYCEESKDTAVPLPEPVKLEIGLPFYTQIDDIGGYILKCQIPQGGICRNLIERNHGESRSGFMTTYCFAGAALVKAFQMTGREEYLAGAEKFVDFWMSYQNKEPDRFGVAGTFYDKYIDQSGNVKDYHYTKEVSLSNAGGPGYDASDADGPVIAWAAWEYYQMTGRTSFLEKYRDNFKLILKSIEATKDPEDSLTWCHPNWQFKYLMDVCEVWAFLGSLENIFGVLSEKQLSEYCGKWRSEMAKSIDSWWNAQGQWYHWYRDNRGNFNEKLDWSKWYPDAAEQIWPLLWDVTSPSEPKSIAVWKSFNTNISDWFKSDVDWPAAGYVAVKMGDYDKAFSHTKRLLENKLADPQWQTNEAATAILSACMNLNIIGGLHIVEDTFKYDGININFEFSAMRNPRGKILIRKNILKDMQVFIDGDKQTLLYEGDYAVIDFKAEPFKNYKFSVK